MPNQYSKFFNKVDDLEREIRRGDGTAAEPSDIIIYNTDSELIAFPQGDTIGNIEDLGNVNIGTTGPVNGDLLVYDAQTRQWRPGSQNTESDVPLYPFELINRDITFTLNDQTTGVAAATAFTITNGVQGTQTRHVGQTWSFLQPAIVFNPGYEGQNIAFTVTGGALTGTVGTDDPPDVVVTLTGNVIATTQTARLSLSGSATNVSAMGGSFTATGTIGQAYTLVLPTLTPDDGYTIGTAAYGAGSGNLTGTFGANDITVTRVLSGAASPIQRTITFTFVNNVTGPAAGVTFSGTTQAAQSGGIGDTWSFNEPTFVVNQGHSANITLTTTQGALRGTIGATAPANVVVTATGSITVNTFTATATYTGTTVGSAGATLGAGSFTTNLVGASATVPSNAATDGASRLDSTDLGNSGGGSTTTDQGAPVYPTDQNQVFAGATYTQTGSQATQTVREPLTNSVRYTNTITRNATNTSNRTVQVIVSGTIPTGQNFANEGGVATIEVGIPQAGDTGSAPPTRTAPCGRLAAGDSCTDTTTINAGGTTTGSRTVTRQQTGTGTYTFNAAPSATTVRENDTITYNVSGVTTTHSSNAAGAQYTWTFNGAFSGTRTGSTVQITPTTTGTVTATVTGSFTGDHSSTFTHTATPAAVTVEAAGCTGTATATLVRVEQVDFNDSRCVYNIQSSTGFFVTFNGAVAGLTGGTVRTPGEHTLFFTRNQFLGATPIRGAVPTNAGGLICSGTGAEVAFNGGANDPSNTRRCPTGSFTIPT